MSQRIFFHAHNSAKTIIKCSKGGLQWIKKVNNCDLALTAQDLKSQWYLDSGCSKHMTGDKNKFITLDEKKSGNVIFGNDKSGKIKGKGSVIIDNGRGKAQEVLFVDGLKANLLSVSQMCDKGCEVLFRAQDCVVRTSTTGKTLLKGVRTENNVYIVKEEDEACHLRKLEESWLWHKRLGHLSFDHIIRLSKKKAVRDMLEIKGLLIPYANHVN